MTIGPFTRAFLLMFSGPLIWAVHFLAVYVLAALACARGFADLAWLGASVAQWGIGVMTLGAVAAVIVVQRRGSQATPFLDWTTLTLGWLSILAIVWEALPAYLVPACA